MTNISHVFNDLFQPASLLVFYKNQKKEMSRYYVELFPLDAQGHPLAPHPLSEEEARRLAGFLQQPNGSLAKRRFLEAESIFSPNVLHIGNGPEPFAIWFTPPMVASLLFQPALKTPSGPAGIPPLIWKATAKTLAVYAVKEEGRPTITTRLYHAPFFNLHPSGDVCMGTVRITVPSDCSLERFMSRWQAYFFGSYFSHLLLDGSPVQGNIVELWQNLVGTTKPFPLGALKPSAVTLKQLIA